MRVKEQANTVGFVGTGIMGSAMVLRLLDRGWRVNAWNRELEALGPLIAQGAVACESPADVARRSHIVLICVLDPQMQRRDFNPPRNFARQILKDLKGVTAFADGLRLPLPLVSAARDQFYRYVAAGNEMHDSAGVIDLYQDASD